MLFICYPLTFQCVISDVKEFAIQMPQAELPSGQSFRWCYMTDLPGDTDYHIIATKPITQRPDLVHHMKLFACAGPGIIHTDYNAIKYGYE